MGDFPKEHQPSAERDRRIFRKSVSMQMNLYAIIRSLKSTEGRMCLEIGTNNGMMSHHLRKLGGTWHTLVTDPQALESVRATVGDENVYLLEGEALLPFKKKVFDVVVVTDFLERLDEDESFIEECHKILKPDGRLVLSTRRVKTWTVIRLLRLILGLSRENLGLARVGYTESELFGVLKHGFDVVNMHSHTRFFVEFVDTFVQFALKKAGEDQTADRKTAMRIYALAAPFYLFASQLDILLLFSKGHRLIATAKRRAWRPRNAPVLVDGRSISEAVLSKAAD